MDVVGLVKPYNNILNGHPEKISLSLWLIACLPYVEDTLITGLKR